MENDKTGGIVVEQRKWTSWVLNRNECVSRFKMSFPVWSIILGHSVVVELKNSTKISSAEEMERNKEGQNPLFFCCVITTKKSPLRPCWLFHSGPICIIQSRCRIVRSTGYGYTTCSTAIPCTKDLSVKQWLSLVSLPFWYPLLFLFPILPSSLLSVYVCPTPVEPSLPPREPGIIVPG